MEFETTPLQEPAGPDRRGFLKAAGFTFGLMGMAGCRQAPVQKALPFVNLPEGIVPGRPNYYATTCAGCTAGCGVLAKVRDGRPIKLEGNPQHPLSKGGLCAVGQAEILGLYDSLRLRQPLIAGQPATWDRVDREIVARLKSAKTIRFLTQTITSPTLRAAIARFPNARHVIYDPLSVSAILDAHHQTHGIRAIPRYHFDKAETIVSFDADFLGTWISPVEFTAAYAQARPHHIQYEGRMSLTGTRATRRIPTAPSELAARMRELDLSKLPRGRSLIVCGAQNIALQILVNRLNQDLGNYGVTLDIEHPSYQKQGNDAELQALLAELAAGKVDALFVYGVNPAYDLPSAALNKAGLLVTFAQRLDETAALAHYCCPDRHPLESWADAEPVAGLVTLTQPVIRPLGDTRPVLETLSAWSGQPQSIREHWNLPPDAWDKALEAGFFETTPHPPVRTVAKPTAAPTPDPIAPTGFELVLYPKPALLDGRHAYNPWLQELPDPVTKVTWDNYACVAPATAARLKLQQGDVVRVAGLELPVVIQPGQHERVVAIALGYGSRLSARFANLGPQWIGAQPIKGLVGKNVAPLAAWRGPVNLTPTGGHVDLACTQEHHMLPAHAKPILEGPHEHHGPAPDLWPDDHPKPVHRWAMAIDLNACTGCSACVVACQVENNIPVVGRDEVRRRREMHWMRIDRYYTGDPGNPAVAHQPMMCQQCGHAPCETVCPVLATVHSAEGLNQQVYNRCVGTRYCANNCPYKARRFNWFQYAREDRLANMVLNPDVAVRSRGVMEKCTFCVQRIQEAKIEAKRKGVPLADGDVQPACQQSCPAGAIIFGDLNDPKSRIAQAVRRGYRVLEDLNVQPAVTYIKEQHHG